MKITQAQARRRVEDIRKSAYDPEVAHGSEDALHKDVLKAIRDGATDAKDLAHIALLTDDIDFPRWCA